MAQTIRPDEIEIRRRLSYSPLTGQFIWIAEATSGPRMVGKIAGTINNQGYVHISINRQKHVGGRLAWLYMTGEWPEEEIDHVNRCRADNRWCNLRKATDSQNATNSKLRSTNTSGFRGVSWFEPLGKWKVSVTRNRVRRHLGYFDCVAAAYCAYLVGAAEAHGEFTPFSLERRAPIAGSPAGPTP